MKENTMRLPHLLLMLVANILLVEFGSSEESDPNTMVLEEFYIPANIPDEPMPTRKGVVVLTGQSKVYAKSGLLFVPRQDIYESLQQSGYYNNTKKQGGHFFQPWFWTEWTCCRSGINLQARMRISHSEGAADTEVRPCQWNYCPASECRDNNRETCSYFRRYGRTCDARSRNIGFLVSNCPQTCGWCSRPNEAAPRPPQTVPNQPRIVKISVYASDSSDPKKYKYSASAQNPGFSYKEETNEAFYLYTRPHGEYRTPIYFCFDDRRDVESIMQTRCSDKGLKTKYTFFSASRQVSGSTFILVATITRPDGSQMSKAFQYSFCCGYGSRVTFIIFGTKKPATSPAPFFPGGAPPPPNTGGLFERFTTTPMTYVSSSPFIPPAGYPPAPNGGGFFGFFTTTKQTPLFPTANPGYPGAPPAPIGGGGPPLGFGMECFNVHNYFRDLHNTPRLAWDNALTASAQRWANYLVQAAPQRPNQINPGFRRTSNWPHSDTSSGYRQRGVGENIMWELQTGKTSPETTTLRWYAEIFDYNRNNPMQGRNGKPVGHYTQVLWKDTKLMGCAIATRKIMQYGQPYSTTYVVAHYSPGTIYDPSSRQRTLDIFNRNVPVARPGSCQSQCSATQNCMAYGPGSACNCNGFTTPVCRGRDACIARCERPQGFVRGHFKDVCRGRNSCQCTNQGAVCS